MSATTRIGGAVAAGYVLGRFRKMRMALIVGSALANRNVRSAGMDLIRGSSGDQQRSPLVDAGRSAVITAASSTMNRLSDRLHERSVSLNGGEEESEEDRDEEPPEDEDLDDEEYDDAEEEGESDEDEDELDDDEPDEDEPDEDDEDDEDEAESSRSTRRRRTSAPGRS